MAEDPMIPQADVRLVFEVVRQRYLRLPVGHDPFPVYWLALEGLKWLLGEETTLTRQDLVAERQGGSHTP